MSEAEQILSDKSSDSELKKMAEGEIGPLKIQIESGDALLKRLLIPKDPNDHKNVILEIRAGTGGEEAALFASELYRMYLRFAEQKDSRPEPLT